MLSQLIKRAERFYVSARIPHQAQQMRDAGDIVLFSSASASKRRLGEVERREMPSGHFIAERPTLIELVNDVPGAG